LLVNEKAVHFGYVDEGGLLVVQLHLVSNQERFNLLDYAKRAIIPCLLEVYRKCACIGDLPYVLKCSPCVRC
jgi:hypothetical protein